ncbi:MAG: L-arabinitol 4-dehydrogenase [Alectoria fallacina]|uniref:L-arabinitol 4-dehydrogenase n=1 Tax=Alectoria fallacina TaxID=1903189 RepID=A0A8H3ICI7_9LECA|nr:MAG: L-arabinitol 4-dehydrogenase [Alectoria fallacina]
MEALLEEHEKLCRKGNLSKSVEDVQKTIDLLVRARESIAANQNSASVTLAKLQNPVKQSFEAINSDLKDVYKGLGNYSKALDKKFRDKPLPATDYDALSSHPALINRAIAMHFLREGQFSVASTFLTDATNNPPRLELPSDTPNPDTSLEVDLGIDSLKSESLRKQFANMYHILHELKNQQNLLPAIAWARDKSDALETRGSNLEFELSKLQFVWLFTGGSNPNDARSLLLGQQQALEYARREFAHFQGRYLREIQQLSGAMAFCPNLAQSPYRRIFHNEDAWEDLANSFTREFCSLLGLSADSPLYVAATAGAIALPTLLKLQTIMKEKRTEWTTQHELPVEIPLPPAYHFHSIFVCPVSKEQTTDENPPMMMPCGHVVAQESLARLSKGSRFKCPYCPSESRPEDSKKLFISACTTASAPERLHNNAGSKTSSSTTVPADQKANFTSLSSPPRPSPTSLLRPQNKATMATVTETVSLPNVGVFTDPEHKLWVAESVPTLESVKKGQDLKHGEVTIGIKSTGICGSDIHFWHAGRIGPMIVTDTHILGHESAGVILATHPSVTHLKPGDRVAIEPDIICGHCEPCLTGRYNGCLNMRFLSTPPVDGLLRRYVNHPAVWCHKIGDMSFENGALLEPLSVALAGVERAGVKLGDPVLICGAGPIGLITLLCAAAAGAEPIVVTDIDEGRLAFAKELIPRVRTFKVERLTRDEDAAEKIVELAGGVQPAIALECTGVESSISAAIHSVKFGGKVFVIGVGKPEMQLPFMRLSTQEIDLQFQYRYANTWPRAIRLVESGVVDLGRMVTHRFDIEDAVRAFETAADPKTGAIKVQIQSEMDVQW